MVCSSYLWDLRQYLKGDDNEKEDFDSEASCPFRVSSNKSTRNGNVSITFSLNSNLGHSALCGSQAIITKGEMLATPSFLAAVSTNKGVSSKTLSNLLMEENLAERAQNLRTLQRARSSIKGREAKLWNPLWAALPGYLDDLKAKNPGSTITLEWDPISNVFKRAFVMLGGAIALVRKVGRRVMGADFCHSRNDFFGGVYANSTFQLGNGTLFELFFAFFAGALF